MKPPKAINNTMDTRILPLRVVSLWAFIACSGPAAAGFAKFDEPTDTISISGNTILGTQATFEAVIRKGDTSRGMIWNEFAASQEDKQLGFLVDGQIYGYAYNSSPFNDVLAGGVPEPGDWRHYAYVYDGVQERVYVDGVLVNSRSSSANIADSASSQMVIGAALFRGSQFHGFTGDIDSLRVSDVARYSGPSFTPVLGDFSNDASTLLLFNFNEAAGTTTIGDQSGSGATGTLGTGFAGATSPTFELAEDEVPTVVIEPAVALSWQSVAGVVYQPQVSESLAPAAWSNFGPSLAGDGSMMRIFDVTGGAPRKFYRLVLGESP